MTNIEEYIKNKKGRLYTNNITVILYDQQKDIYHFLFKINKNKDECLMMTSPTNGTFGSTELNFPFISQLNYYYGDCTIISDHSYLGMRYEKVKELLEKNYTE